MKPREYSIEDFKDDFIRYAILGIIAAMLAYLIYANL